MKNKKLLFIAIIALTALIANILIYLPKTNTPSDYSIKTDSSSFIAFTRFADSSNYGDLPIGEIKIQKPENAWGAVVFIPQAHRYPGSAISDQKNDLAETTQNQMYEIISYLHKNFAINFIMTEGELYGSAPKEKISQLSEKINLRNEFASQIENLENETIDSSLNTHFEKEFFTRANNTVELLDREIILQGAGHKLKAEIPEITLFGSENQATREKCAIIVRNYIYQQDQLNECSAPAAKSTSPLPTASLHNLLLSKENAYQNTLSLSDFSSFKSLANRENKGDLTASIESTEHTYIKIQNLNKSTPAQLSTPLREDNPYQGITNSRELEKMINSSEKQIQEIVIDKRNEETAENFAKMLKENNATIGMLEFGAGHKDGLTKSLTGQGLIVITLTPEALSRKRKKEDEEDKV